MPRTTALALLALATLAAPARAEEAAGDGKPAPAAATPARDSTSPVPTSDETTVLYSLGARARYLAVPGFLLSPFLQQYTELSSGGFGLEFTRRKGNLDIVLSLDYSLYSPPAGNYLGANKDPSLDTHYVQFRNLSLLALDVAFYWVHDLASWLAFFIGGGVGVGVVIGDIMVVNNGTQCNAANARDPEQCHPVGPNGPVKPSDPMFQQKLEALKSPKDTAQNPNYHAASEKPPVMVVVNFLIGFKLKLHRHFHVNISGGFRDGFVVGGGPEFVF